MKTGDDNVRLMFWIGLAILLASLLIVLQRTVAVEAIRFEDRIELKQSYFKNPDTEK